ncbi:HlyD family efflux transporter periplasmic adaptor subunit [bacterium SCSIO 12741]|nr:HlyD family efflux transporter periplasmic adaptor subunit [bacterium SCSIO 12741]
MDRIIPRKKWYRRGIYWIGFGSGTLILLLILLSNRSNGSSLKVNSTTLTLATVDQGPFREFVPVTGVFIPIHTVQIDASNSGIIEELFVEDGAQVNQGDPLIRLSNTTLQMTYMSQEAQLLDQLNNLNNTRLRMEEQSLNLRDQFLDIEYRLIDRQKDFQRNKKLFDAGAISADQFENVEDEFQYLEKRRELLLDKIKTDSLIRAYQQVQMKQSAKLIERNLEMIHQNLEDLVIRAPFNGHYSTTGLELGQAIAQGANLGQIDEMEAMKLRAQIDEHYLGRVFPGQIAHYERGDSIYELEIIKIFSEVDNGTFSADFRFTTEVPLTPRRGKPFGLNFR